MATFENKTNMTFKKIKLYPDRADVVRLESEKSHHPVSRNHRAGHFGRSLATLFTTHIKFRFDHYRPWFRTIKFQCVCIRTFGDFGVR